MIRSTIRAYTSALKRNSWRVRALWIGAVLAAVFVAIFAGSGVLAATKDTTPGSVCSTGMLSLNRASMSYGTFKYLDIYALTNTSQVACTLEGYPQVALRTASGAAVQSVQVTDATDTGVYNVAAASPVTLQPGEAAALYIGSIGNPGASEACDPASREMGVMEVTPPGDTVALTVPVPVNTGCPTAPLYVSPIMSSVALPTTTTTTPTTTTTAATTTAPAPTTSTPTTETTTMSTPTSTAPTVSTPATTATPTTTTSG